MQYSVEYGSRRTGETERYCVLAEDDPLHAAVKMMEFGVWMQAGVVTPKSLAKEIWWTVRKTGKDLLDDRNPVLLKGTCRFVKSGGMVVPGWDHFAMLEVVPDER